MIVGNQLQDVATERHATTSGEDLRDERMHLETVLAGSQIPTRAQESVDSRLPSQRPVDYQAHGSTARREHPLGKRHPAAH